MKMTPKLVLSQETLKNLTARSLFDTGRITSNYTAAEPCCACSVK
jgi:hypothetical protein